MADIYKDTTKFKIHGCVNEFDKTAKEEQEIECK